MRLANKHICGNEVKGPHHPDHFGPPGSGGSNGDYWSGYVATSGGFNWISSAWTVPCYSGSNNSQRALQWVGLGGYSGSYLWQGGTETDHAEGYRFWYEDVPGNNIIYAGPSVSCGNHVAVEVDYNFNISGESYVYMSNYSNGQYYATSKTFHPGNNSAEWIVERTSCGSNKNYALAPFSQVPWSEANAASTNYYSDVGYPISAFSYFRADMYQNGILLSNNSDLEAGGSQFITYYQNSGVTYC